MEAYNGRFKAGNAFKKGEVLIAIRSSDQKAQLYAQRSSFQSGLNAIMPDLKIDYPDEFGAWQQYLKSYASMSMVEELPLAKSEKLNAFLVGRGIYSNYHSLKSQEIINAKYQIRAPYDGVLISTKVNPGTVIRQGQALAVFIQPQFYEMETSIDAVSAGHLKIGQTVALKMQGVDDKIWKGKIARLVKAIDPNSQMSTFFVALNGNDLKEGMFMQAKVAANKIIDAYEISRSSLVENSKVYVVQADTLVLKAIKKEHVSQHTVVISGLKDSAEVLTKIPPSAFPGMKVSIYKAQH
jgi:multidrug efflux pump subunit AcrA (membrane-fusion protein)